MFRSAPHSRLESDAPGPHFDKMQEETVQPHPQEGEKSLEQLLAEAQAKMEQQRESMLRAVAEAENARKRAQADASNNQKYAIERFAESLLPVVDSLEAALAAASQAPENASGEALLRGVEVTLKQLLTALERARVTPIAAAPGERFDPYRHQAMASVESDAEPNTIVSVMQKGYHLHDRVLRPALVSVAKEPAKVENDGANPISDM
jgi:molecular chaperone GrpE